MMPNKLIRPLATIAVLVMIAAGGFLVWPDRGKADDKYQVTAYFDKAIGLFENSDVNILGVPVGKVTTVDPQGPRVKVVMEVSKDYKIPTDAVAQIVPISVISDRFVEFTPAYTGGPFMQDGTILEVEQTAIPAELDDVFKQLKKLLDAIQPGGPGEPGALGELIVELDRAFAGREDDLQGALTEGAELTDTLADTKGDLQGLLANLDSLFGKLATRSGEFDTLNQNLITVLTAINESRDDLEGTLTNLADLSGEVTDLVRDDGQVLEDDLRRAAKVLRVLLKNEKSVRQSLDWLPIVGWGLRNAYNSSEASTGDIVDAVDVRDNLQGKIQCQIIDEIPNLIPEVKELLEDICKSETGEPGGEPLPIPPAPSAEQPTQFQIPELDCSEGIRRVKRQLKRIAQLGLPAEVKTELLDPLGDRLRKLAKKCDELIENVENPKKFIDELLEKVPDVGDVPDIDDALDGLTGNAAGTAVAPAPMPEDEEDESWFDSFLGFLGL